MKVVRDLAQRWLLPFADPRRLASIMLLPRFFMDMLHYKRSAPGEKVALIDAYPCLLDRTSATPFDSHYFYQGAWLARQLALAPPLHHVDVGSSVLTVSVLSGFVHTTFVDYRPLQHRLRGLSMVAGNAMQLPFADGSLKSVSCLHVVEHVGLGRYGDPIAPGGTRAAIGELARVVTPGGRLYLTTPVGRERVCFNAHRVSSPHSVLDAATGLRLLSFALVDDQGAFELNCSLSRGQGLNYGCGMFEFERPVS